MRRVLFCAFLVLAAGPAWAQWSVPARQTFTSDIVAEETGGNGPVSPTATAGGTVARSSPFLARGVVVTISETSGFARDAALTQAAGQALPGVLTGGLEMGEAEAAARARSVGDAMQFVSGYVIVKEGLVPTYSLTVDLTFDEEKLRKNFGGVVARAVSGSVVSGTAWAPAPPVPGERFVVRIENGDPVVQNSVLEKISALPRAQAKYRVIASNGAEFELITSAGEDEVEAALRGTGAVIARGLAQPVAEAPVSPTQELPRMPVAGGAGDPSVGEMLWPMREGPPDGAE